ncbi:hypothetical protein BU14_0532s0017 [Porphyra umbilicalis]|uniref:Uncharacterized protein n=1 Tax=Porphyra umbilicalis TaxID=2786 RepID=A0A1X6NS97_PORUM|nr:hypothetical protein BU14_0532s0017 [Porphyra umbilicalis]|eukprot:OSX71458.1 hypothetical protein BU14_0532s0017 [Porphyra umbilicalis]
MRHQMGGSGPPARAVGGDRGARRGRRPPHLVVSFSTPQSATHRQPPAALRGSIAPGKHGLRRSAAPRLPHARPRPRLRRRPETNAQTGAPRAAAAAAVARRRPLPPPPAVTAARPRVDALRHAWRRRRPQWRARALPPGGTRPRRAGATGRRRRRGRVEAGHRGERRHWRRRSGRGGRGGGPRRAGARPTAAAASGGASATAAAAGAGAGRGAAGGGAAAAAVAAATVTATGAAWCGSRGGHARRWRRRGRAGGASTGATARGSCWGSGVPQDAPACGAVRDAEKAFSRGGRSSQWVDGYIPRKFGTQTQFGFSGIARQPPAI